MVVSKILPSSKGVPKQGDHKEKTNKKDRACKMLSFLATKNQDQTMAKLRAVEVIKAKTFSL